MVIPGLIGLWIDRRLGTVALFLGLGMALGLITGIWHLIRLGQQYQRDQTADKQPSGPMLNRRQENE
jgi:F0F1-type ATP synthase assembly protein I